jgi:hypothetical protein
MQAIGINSEKLPLGKLSKTVIKQAYKTLGDLALLLSPPGSGAAAGKGTKRAAEIELSTAQQIRVKALSTKFNTLIPCAAYHIVPIDSIDKLKEKILLLDELMNVEAGLDLMAVAGGGEVNVDRCYSRLGIKLDPVAQSAVAFKTIVDYVAKTHSSQHSSYQLTVLTVFIVDNDKHEKEFDRHSSKITNKQLLWHGSRLSNWTGILSQGLRIAPPEAPVTGCKSEELHFCAKLAPFLEASRLARRSPLCTCGCRYVWQGDMQLKLALFYPFVFCFTEGGGGGCRPIGI